MATDPIDTSNKFLAGVRGFRVVLMKPPVAGGLTADDAYLLAAWLVAMAQSLDGAGAGPTHEFEDVLQAVQST